MAILRSPAAVLVPYPNEEVPLLRMELVGAGTMPFMPGAACVGSVIKLVRVRDEISRE